MKYFSKFFLVIFFLEAVVFLQLTGPVPLLFAKDSNVRILFIGDSISAGLGVEPEYAYPALIQDVLQDKGIQAGITNGSISGSTTAGAFSRLKWFLKVKPDILVLALGANDGMRGLSTVEMALNLDKAIVLAKENGIQVILAGMEVPPNYGPEYAIAFRNVFISLAQKNKISLIPFLLKDVAGNALFNQADGIHPNREGHRIIAATVLYYILELL